MKENIGAYFYINGKSNNYILHYLIKNNSTEKTLIKITRKLKEQNFKTANFQSLYYILKDILALIKLGEISDNSHVFIFTELKDIKNELNIREKLNGGDYEYLNFFLDRLVSYECIELKSVRNYIYHESKPPIAIYLKCKKAGKEYKKVIKRNSTLKKLDRLVSDINEFIFFDFEMNCVGCFNDVEIISIGAVKTDLNGRTISKFYKYIKPKNIFKLTDRCIEITSIDQKDIDNAWLFEDVFRSFESWCGKSKKAFLYWGGNDIAVLKNDSERIKKKINIVNKMLENNIDYQEVLCKDIFELNDSLSLTNALIKANLEFSGIQHNALDDAYNLSRLYFNIKERR
ncbi:MAG: exonuclease domain-containing protein [Clostridium sp.]|uniref:exonuclease domain-containing protein n=1 Tax=Clostridium sp. TaxID=1506 RepID=UPI003F3D4F99